MTSAPHPPETLGSATDAVAWACAQWPADEVHRLSERNWATTYQLRKGSASAYLKVLPVFQARQIQRYTELAERFPQQTPRLLAALPHLGWLLLEDHGGQPLDGELEDLVAVATALARLQLQAASDRQFLMSLRHEALSDALPGLMAFLDRPAQQTGAAGFLGDAAAERYARLIRTHSANITTLVARAAALPDTLAHGDLHIGNAARHPDGRMVLFDWDEMAAGPAGLCLHGLLSGCAMAVTLLHRMAKGLPVPSGEASAVLDAYIGALAEGGYASRDTLVEALSGALCAGQMRFITSFGQYPGEAERSAAARTLTRRLEDLLDLCDWMVSKNPTEALACADAYETQAEWQRALRLTQDLLAHAPKDASLLRRYARLCDRQGQTEAAAEAWQELLKFAPHDLEALTRAALLSLDRLDMAGCNRLLASARTQATASPALLSLQDRADLFMRCLALADTSDGWPRVPVSERERDNGRLDASTHALVLHLFRQQGAVQLDGVFSPALMAQLQQAFEQQHAGALNSHQPQGVLQVGHRRYMLTMTLDSTFGAPALVASGLYLPVMQALLGGECILSAYTAVVSFPGSTDQDVHKDHTALFEELGWQSDAPTFAAQVVVPLLEMNALTGATAVFKGSQGHTYADAADELPFQEPEVPLGSCLLIDYAAAHFGRGNRSSQVRPILNLVYSRPWFRDCRNYHLQPPLRFAGGGLNGLDTSVRPLVSWWDQECRAALQAHSAPD